MNDLQIQDKQEVIDIVGAAELLKCSHPALRMWLKVHPEIKEKYCRKERYEGRRKTVIQVEALALIANMRNDNGRKVKESLTFKEAKRNIIEKEIRKPRKSLSELRDIIDHMIAQDAQVKETGNKVHQLESKVADLEGDTTKIPITEGQRKRLHERVNYFCFWMEEHRRIKIRQGQVYRKIHDMTGRKTTNDYVFEDYKIAIKVLKDWYKQFNVTW